MQQKTVTQHAKIRKQAKIQVYEVKKVCNYTEQIIFPKYSNHEIGLLTSYVWHQKLNNLSY